MNTTHFDKSFTFDVLKICKILKSSVIPQLSTSLLVNRGISKGTEEHKAQVIIKSFTIHGFSLQFTLH